MGMGILAEMEKLLAFWALKSGRLHVQFLFFFLKNETKAAAHVDSD